MAFGDFIQDAKRLPTTPKKARASAQRSSTVAVAGGHSKYFPGEWSLSFGRKYLEKSDPTKKRESFEEICKQCSPVFRFFFMEKFGHNKAVWHAAQQRYTRSVAVSSIVGHILGIGDRHTSNILVHKKTGEVVHIDFGIVFEQGKVRKLQSRRLSSSETTSHIMPTKRFHSLDFECSRKSTLSSHSKHGGWYGTMRDGGNVRSIG